MFSYQEFADALMEVKCAIMDIRKSPTLKLALGSLLSIGNFLNGKQVGRGCSIACSYNIISLL